MNPDVSTDRSPVADRPRRHRLRGDEGAALAEFALVLPFLAVLVLGTVDIGRAFAMKNRLANMAREGAFHAQYRPHDISGCAPTSITSVARNEDPGLTGATVAVTNALNGATITNSCGATPTPGVRVEVRVSRPLELFTPFVGAAAGDSITLAAEVVTVVQG